MSDERAIERQIQEAANLIRASRRPSVLTGAGASKESGIPTFRDALDGLWANFDPMTLATPQAFARNPKLVWDFYAYRRELMRPAQPNPAHRALAALERLKPDLLVITQNIDDLHEQAGSQRVIHLHGRLDENRCHANCRGEPTLIDVSTLDWDPDSGPPTCPYCGQFVRPNVVWFHELLPRAALDAAQAAVAETDLMIVVGTSGVVYPAADMPFEARRRGATIIEFNPFRSEITPIADLWLAAPAGETLPRVIAALESEAG